ncbi:MAG: fluoride efflux transporter CrcB [Chloroflexi bacterium]|nr:fluoride efflux transporter CrcB [Chloroflexota bacterium]
MESLIAVGVGGFFGAIARYVLTLAANHALTPALGAFPYGTLLVNVLGSFGLALFGLWFGERAGLSPQLRLLVGSGFFGAFTTFSAFANESYVLASEGKIALFLLNAILNYGLCLLGVALGVLAGSRAFGAA